jgi:hypothetical protein
VTSLVIPTPILSRGSISHWTVRVIASTAQNVCRLTSIIAGNLFKEELVIRERLLVHLHCWRVLENRDLSHFRIPDTVWFSSCLYYKHPATEQVDRTVTAGMEHICVAFWQPIIHTHTTAWTHTGRNPGPVSQRTPYSLFGALLCPGVWSNVVPYLWKRVPIGAQAQDSVYRCLSRLPSFSTKETVKTLFFYGLKRPHRVPRLQLCYCVWAAHTLSSPDCLSGLAFPWCHHKQTAN